MASNPKPLTRKPMPKHEGDRRMTLRLNEALADRLEAMAVKEGVSLNYYINQVLHAEHNEVWPI